jgi:hypothetical protein
MNIVVSKVGICAVALIVTLISGVILSNAGRPYNSAIFSLHKLVSIAAVIVLGVSVYNLHQSGNMITLYALVFAATGLFFLALIVSGSLLSLVDAEMLTLNPAALRATLIIHQITPLLVLVSSAASFYVLVSKQA